MPKLRSVAAVLIAPAVVSAFVAYFDRQMGEITLALGCISALILGLPAHAVLTRRSLRKVYHYAAAGFVIGSLSGAVALSVLIWSDHHSAIGASPTVLSGIAGIAREPALLLGIGLLGLAGAILFWIVARPDRDL